MHNMQVVGRTDPQLYQLVYLVLLDYTACICPGLKSPVLFLTCQNPIKAYLCAGVQKGQQLSYKYNILLCNQDTSVF